MAFSCSDPEQEEINFSPVAKFSFLPVSPEVEKPILFDGSSSVDSGGYIAEFHWLFDGENSEFGETVNFTFSTTGNHTVTLIVTDDGGVSDTTSKTLLLNLAIVAIIDIPVKSPSGLCLSIDRNSLWTVSDKPNGLIYNLDFDGKLLRTLDYIGTDLEGIAHDNSDTALWITEESMGKILQIDTVGNVIKSMELSGVRDGGGLEGITFNRNNGHFFLVKEKDPGALIELDGQLNLISYDRIGFAEDFSGLDYDADEEYLWMISDQDKVLMKYKLGSGIVEKHPFNINKAEGLAIYHEKNIFFIVSDDNEKLYKLVLP